MSEARAILPTPSTSSISNTRCGDLGPDDRRLIALRYVAGLNSTEIAAQLGGSASGIRF